MNEIKKIGGLKELTPDNRDFNLGTIFSLPPLEDLPEEYFDKPLSIKNQNSDGNFDFCASCAASGAVEQKEEVELFYPFLFAAAKYESGDDPDSWGSDLRSIAKALCKWGCPEIKDVPEEIKNLSSEQRRRFENYPESLRQAALKHKQKTYFFLNGKYDAFNDARAAIWKFKNEARHIIFGVNWGWDLKEFELNGKPDGFGHALWQNGWIKDYLYIVNSAGKEAGKDGIHLISRETFNHYADKYGVVMFVDMEKEIAQRMVDYKIKDTDNWIMDLLKSLIGFFKSIILPVLPTEWRQNRDDYRTISYQPFK